MNLQHRSASTVERSDMHYGSKTRLQGRWLLIARVSWVALTLLVLTMQPASVSLWLRPPAHQQVSWRATPAVPSQDEARGEK
jgi:hypothetical protein